MNTPFCRFGRLARRFGATLATCTLALAASSAADPVKVEGKTIDLPDFTVTDSRVLPEARPWLYGRVGRFEVLSSAGERRTRKLLADFQRFQQALGLLWTAPMKPLASSTLVLCARDGEFASLLPTGTDAQQDASPSRLLRDRESLAIAVNLAAERLFVDDATALAATGANTVELDVDHAQLLYREYIFSLLNQSESRPPLWMAEGLAQIVMDAEVTDRSLVYGKVDTYKGSATGGPGTGAEDTDASANGTAVVGEQPFNFVLRYRKLMPLGEFFAVTADSPAARTPLGNNLWAKQAYLFVHFCLFGEDLRHRDALPQFVARLSREPLSESLFRECFKIGYAEMHEQLRAYLRHVKHKYQTYAIQPTDRLNPASIELTSASYAQVGVILGDAQRIAGRMDQAAITYRDAYFRGVRDPALLAGLAAAERAAGHTERADKFLTAACAGKAPRPSAHAALARQRLDAARAQPAGADGKLDTAQMAAVLGPIFEARKHPPLIPETYHVAADAWAASAIPPKPANLAVLDEGMKSFPRDSALVLKGARLYASIGANDIATSIARMGLRFASEASAKQDFERLLSQLSTPTPR